MATVTTIAGGLRTRTSNVAIGSLEKCWDDKSAPLHILMEILLALHQRALDLHHCENAVRKGLGLLHSRVGKQQTPVSELEAARCPALHRRALDLHC